MKKGGFIMQEAASAYVMDEAKKVNCEVRAD